MMKFCECAVNLTRKSTHPVFRHGAILVKGNEIVGTGYNNQFHHAEVKAILHCLQRVLRGSGNPKGKREQREN